jgi:hypothetical protein
MPSEVAQLLRLFAKDVTLSAVSWMQWLGLLSIRVYRFIRYLFYYLFNGKVFISINKPNTD